jgi:hypothetical protein
VLILLLTEKVLSRPACLLELYAAATHNVPIIVLRCEGPSCSQADELPKILSDLPAHLRLHGQSQILDDSGLINLDAHEVHAAELSKKLRAAMLGLNWRKKLLSFASHASGKHRDGQAAMITKEMVKHTGEFAESNKVVQENAALNTELLSVSEATETKMGLDSTQKLCVVHSEQADDEAVRLRHELTKRTDLTDNQILLRGEVEDLASEGVVVVMMLQTRDVLHETHCLGLLYKALESKLPLITINLATDHPSLDNPKLKDMGYSYGANAELMMNLSSLGLPDGELEAMCGLERGKASIHQIQEVLSDNIPKLISIDVLAESGGPETGSGAKEYQMQIIEVVRMLEISCKAADGAGAQLASGAGAGSAEKAGPELPRAAIAGVHPDIEEGEPVTRREREASDSGVSPRPRTSPRQSPAVKVTAVARRSRSRPGMATAAKKVGVATGAFASHDKAGTTVPTARTGTPQRSPRP